MSVLTREEFLNRLNERVGEDTSDNAISFIEDMTETFDSMSQSDGEDWKKKYEELDESWKKRYRERFFSTPTEENEEDFSSNNNERKPTTFDELFTVKEN